MVVIDPKVQMCRRLLGYPRLGRRGRLGRSCSAVGAVGAVGRGGRNLRVGLGHTGTGGGEPLCFQRLHEQNCISTGK